MNLKTPQEQETCTQAEEHLKHGEKPGPFFLWQEAWVAAENLWILVDIAGLDSPYVWAQ